MSNAVLNIVARLARVAALRDVILAAGGMLDFYAGEPPFSNSDVTYETLLARITLANPLGTVTNVGGVAKLTAFVPQHATVLSSGLIGWVRVNDGATGGIMDLPVGLIGTGSPHPVIVSDLQLYSGGELQLLSFTLTE